MLQKIQLSRVFAIGKSNILKIACTNTTGHRFHIAIMQFIHDIESLQSVLI